MPGYRRLLSLLFLLTAIVGLWACSGLPQCPDNSWDGSPAIARVGDECIYSLQYHTYLRDLSMGLGISDQEAGEDESGLAGYLKGRQRLVAQFGLENAAFATLSQDVALYRAAIDRGHSPDDGEVRAVMGANRDRIRGLDLLLELQSLAQQSELDAFRDLVQSAEGRQVVPVQGEEHVLALFEQAAATDLSGAARGMEIHERMLESVGDDVYWTEVFFEHSGWLVAIESLRLAVDESDGGNPPGLDWQDLREEIWANTDIELADAAPQGVTLAEVSQYASGLHALERELLTR